MWWLEYVMVSIIGNVVGLHDIAVEGVGYKAVEKNHYFYGS